MTKASEKKLKLTVRDAEKLVEELLEDFDGVSEVYIIGPKTQLAIRMMYEEFVGYEPR